MFTWRFLPRRFSNNDIIQNRQSVFAGLDFCPLQPLCLAFDLPGHPPSNKSKSDAGSNAGHSSAEALRVPRSILAQEDLRPDRTTNLAVAVDKSDRECRARRSGRCLHTPRPHHWEPRRSHGVADESGRVDGAVAGICYHDAVASQDDDHEREGVDGSG